MGERKVLNKYYPPDFDPTKLIRNKRPKDKQEKIRMMLPMTLRCKTCGNYLPRGKKFNARKETVLGEEYLGIRIFRFFFKCTQCSAEVTMKTDPKNSDYVAESGAVRNYEPLRDQMAADEVLKEKKKAEMEGDAMKTLEHKTYDSRREMEIQDALDEIRLINKRQARINYDDIIAARQAFGREDDDEELDEETQLESFLQQKRTSTIADYDDSDDDDEDDDSSMANSKHQQPQPQPQPNVTAPSASSSSSSTKASTSLLSGSSSVPAPSKTAINSIGVKIVPKKLPIQLKPKRPAPADADSTAAVGGSGEPPTKQQKMDDTKPAAKSVATTAAGGPDHKPGNKPPSSLLMADYGSDSD